MHDELVARIVDAENGVRISQINRQKHSIPGRHVAAVNLFNLPALLLDSQSAQRIQASSRSRNPAYSVMDLDFAAFSKGGEARPLIDDARRPFPFEIHVDGFKFLEELQQNLDSGLNSAGRHSKRSRAIHDVFGKVLVIHVHANANDHRFDQIDLRLNLGENSAELLVGRSAGHSAI